MPKIIGERLNSLEMQPRMTLSSASQDFKRKSDMSSKAASKAPPEEEASRMGLIWGDTEWEWFKEKKSPPH